MEYEDDRDVRNVCQREGSTTLSERGYFIDNILHNHFSEFMFERMFSNVIITAQRRLCRGNRPF